MKVKTLQTLVLLSLLLPLPSAFSQRAGQGTNNLAKFQNALTQDGFDVSIGAAGPLNLVEEWCANTPGLDNALYSNNQPYLGLWVPKSAQESELTTIFQLREDEAIVLIGRTPPPEKYFGFHAFLATKVYPGGRKPVWATLGDTVNNATVKTIGPSPFNRPVVLIFTPDQGTDARIRAALQRAGYPAAIINTIVFPASMLNLGHGETADELRINVRNGIWLDEAAGNAYVNDPPFMVFRVTPSTPAIANPFPMPPLRVRGTGHTEMALLNKLFQLRQAIIDANPGLYATDLPSRPNWYEGFDYIQREFDPWADSRDAFFVTAGWVPEFGSVDKVKLADDEFLVVYGVNHVLTGKATYMSVNAYASEVAKLSIGGIDDRYLTNTAVPYLPGDPAADLMYVYKISRNCGGEPNCMPLGIENCPKLTIDSNTTLGFIFRAYLEPATKVGAALPEVLYDRVIKFSPREPPPDTTTPPGTTM